MHAIIAQAQDFSAAQLVALYNKYADKPVNKFASRATGIKRVTEVIQNALAAQIEQNQENASMNAMTETTVEQVEQATRIALDASDKVETRKAIDASDFDLPTITDLEHRVLAGVGESDFQDGCEPEDCKSVWSFSVTQFLANKRSAGGVIASLVKKGLLHHEPKNGDRDECVSFTLLGAKVFREKVATQPLPVVEKKAKKEKVAKRIALDASDKAKRIALDASDPVKAKRAKKEKAEKVAREPSKVEVMFAMIKEEGGALKSELLKICGWKGCAVSLARACEKAGLELSKTKLEGGDWTYKAIAKA
jgi:hypothetical protein